MLALAAVCVAAVAGTPVRSSTFQVGITLVASCRVTEPAPDLAGRGTAVPGVSCSVARPHAVTVAPERADPAVRSFYNGQAGAPASVEVVTLTF